ncbi:MAG: hypothetical protein ACKVOU_00075 [Cytophagales bacterium]
MKTKLIAVLALFLIAEFNIFAQVGKQFPLLEGKALDGNAIVFPLKNSNKNTLVCLVYSPKTEKALNSWLQPLVNTFLVKNPLDPEPYDINLYFIIMLSGIKNLASDAIETKLKKSVGKDFYKNIIIYQGSLKPYTSELDFGKRDEPYFCVIDKDGKISASNAGTYTPEKLTEIESAVVKE